MPNSRICIIAIVMAVLLTAIGATAQIDDELVTEFDHSRIETCRGFVKGFISYPSSITNAYTRFGSSDLRSTPSWSADESVPPLSPRDAVVIAQSTADEWYNDRDDVSWLLTQIALLPLDSEQGKWCWQATFEVSNGGRKQDLEIVIRMDGVVLSKVNAPGRGDGRRLQ